VPGAGAVYVSQTLQFKAPVYVDDTVTARVEVVRVDAARRLVTLTTTCRKADGTLVIDGEGVAMVPKGTV
jgi:3-hydroxybutyryl-CoA dehydratase